MLVNNENMLVKQLACYLVYNPQKLLVDFDQHLLKYNQHSVYIYINKNQLKKKQKLKTENIKFKKLLN